MSDPQLFDDALTVGQIYRRSKNAIARDFRGPVWIKGEIKNHREVRGMLYLSLIEPGDYNDGGDTSIDVACKPRQKALMEAQLRQAGLKLAAGMQVRVQGTITLSKFSKLQVEMIALDTEALVGAQAAEKRRLYEALVAEGSFDANRRLISPLVPLRVGLVASEGSEGYNDFLGQLDRSPFAFQVTFVHSSVQGPTAPASLARAIDALASASVDVIALVRGGGGELEAFDKELPVRAITRSPHPVWTGIGHTGDRSVSDDVAQVSYITPTECGQALVNTVGAYVTNVDSCLHHLRRHTERALHNESSRLFSNGKHLALTVRGSVDRAEAALRRSGELARRCADRDLALAGAACTGYRKDVQRAATIIPQNALDDLSSLAKRMATGLGRWQQTMAADSKLRRVQVSALDPAQQLRRGYSLTRGDDGRLIRAASDLRPGERIVTRFASGTASSTVDQVENEKEA